MAKADVSPAHRPRSAPIRNVVDYETIEGKVWEGGRVCCSIPGIVHVDPYLRVRVEAVGSLQVPDRQVQVALVFWVPTLRYSHKHRVEGIWLPGEVALDLSDEPFERAEITRRHGDAKAFWHPLFREQLQRYRVAL